MSGLKLILEQNKLTGPNYKDWLRNVKIALTYDKVAYVLTAPEPVLGLEPTIAETEIRNTWDKDCSLAQCLTIASMDLVHQRQHENMDIRSIFRNTEELYGEQPRQMKYAASRNLFQTKMTVGSSVGDHVLKMIAYVNELELLNVGLDADRYTDIILQSLTPVYSRFISQFLMMDLEPTLPALLNLLRQEESSLKKGQTPVLAIGQSSSSSGKLVAKKKGMKKTTKPRKGVKKAVKKDKGKAKMMTAECFHCHKSGH